MKEVRLRPAEFWMKLYQHTVARCKANRFGITQSSCGRKPLRDGQHSLNVKEIWKRKGRSQTKSGRRECYFDFSIAQVAAYQLS